MKDFICRAREIHGNIYDYSKAKYINNGAKIAIICKKHGKFLQRIQDHLDGRGCHKYAVDRMRCSLKKFIEVSTRVHHGKYDYSKSIYTNSTEKIEIICPKHRSFWQTPAGHKNGQGCPSCYSSMGENVIEEELISLGANYKKQVSFEGCRNKNKLRFDFGVYSKNDKLLFLIEFQGIQHYKPIPYFGGQKSLEYTQKRNNIKRQYCLSHNIPLLEISYKDISNTKNLINIKYQYAFHRNCCKSQASIG